MILVDTSVWIRYFLRRAGYVRELDRLLDHEEAAGHELVYGELLIGDTGNRGGFLEAYQRMWQLKVVPHAEVVALVAGFPLSGRGIGWIDAHLLASTLVARARLWTADDRLAKVANELGCGYMIS